MASQDYDSAMEISEEYEYIELAKGLFDKAAEQDSQFNTKNIYKEETENVCE